MTGGLNEDEKAQAAILIAQARVVRVLRAGAVVIAAWLGFRDGLSGLGLGLLLYWGIGLAKPEPPPELDKKIQKR